MSGAANGRSEPSWMSISLRVGDDSSAGCHAYPDRPPIVWLTAGELSVSLSSATPRETGAAVVEADLGFARSLVKAAGTYLAELERLHAKNADRRSDTGGGSAGSGTAA